MKKWRDSAVMYYLSGFVHGVFFMLLLALALAQYGCGDNIDANGRGHGLGDRLTEWLTSHGAVHGTVYVCASGAACDGAEEWCYWPDAEHELEQLLGAACHEITVSERAWPALAGCAYACPLEVRGCNAHCGCFCP